MPTSPRPWATPTSLADKASPCQPIRRGARQLVDRRDAAARPRLDRAADVLQGERVYHLLQIGRTMVAEGSPVVAVAAVRTRLAATLAGPVAVQEAAENVSDQVADAQGHGLHLADAIAVLGRAGGAGPPPAAREVLTLRDGRYRYPDAQRDALRGVTLQLCPGAPARPGGGERLREDHPGPGAARAPAPVRRADRGRRGRTAAAVRGAAGSRPLRADAARGGGRGGHPLARDPRWRSGRR